MPVMIHRPKKIPVFVYGTLRDRVKGLRIGVDGYTIDPFFMFDGAFPIVARVKGIDVSNMRARVLGQMYMIDINELARLDRYEDFPNLYDREILPICVRHVDGEKSFWKSWMYLAPDMGDTVSRALTQRELVVPNELGYLEWKENNLPF